MDSKGIILCCIIVLLSCFAHSLAQDKVKVLIEGSTSVAQTDQNFVCVTLDWWPPEKCNYDMCPWGQAGLLNLNLSNPILANAIKAFNPLRIRIGGSLQDQVVYKVGEEECCEGSFEVDTQGLFGFTDACLPMTRWDELHSLFSQTGAIITFGLNALYGRTKSETEKKLWVGDWNPQNSVDFIKYTIERGYPIDSFEFGNELCGNGVGAKVNADQYAKDLITLKQLLKELHPDSNVPKVIAPGGFYDEGWFKSFLQSSGQDVVDVTSHHIYNLGPGNDTGLINKIQDPFYLSQIAQTFKDLSNTLKSIAPWSGAWVSEAGGAYNSGGGDVSRTFADGFWYLDQLGMTSYYNHKVYCRQALIGGNYALLNTTSFIPNPDYYGALLWHRIMGKDVLSVSQEDTPYLRVYSHCSKNTTGVSLILINLSKDKNYEVTLHNSLNFFNRKLDWSDQKFEFKGKEQREEYHLTPKDGNIQSDVVLLNGKPLELVDSSGIPDLKPILVDANAPITVAAHEILFVTIKDFHAPTCA